MFKKLVKFKDGKYGVRKYVLFEGHKYKDLTDRRNWRKFDSSYFCDCKGTLEEALGQFDTGRPISKKELEQARVMKALGDTSDA